MKVSRGQKVRNDANVYNKTLDMVRNFEAGEPSDPFPPNDMTDDCWILYPADGSQGTANLDAYSIVGLGPLTATPTTSMAGFVEALTFQLATPAAGQPFAVLQEPLGYDSRTSRNATATIHGVTRCKVDFLDANDRWAGPVDGLTTNLVSRSDGPARVLWKEDGTGVLWAVVVIVGRPDCAEIYSVQFAGLTCDAKPLPGMDTTDRFFDVITLSHQQGQHWDDGPYVDGLGFGDYRVWFDRVPGSSTGLNGTVGGAAGYWRLRALALYAPRPQGTTTLDGAIDRTVTTLTVHATATPTTPFSARIDKEPVEVVDVTGTTWTVERGGLALPHGDGAAVTFSFDLDDTSTISITLADYTADADTWDRNSPLNMTLAAYASPDWFPATWPDGVTVSPVSVAPTVDSNTTDLAGNAPAITINGTGFSIVPSEITVEFNNGATGIVVETSNIVEESTATRLVVAFYSPPTTTGALMVTLYVNGVSSGDAVQVANIV